jgi:hypothetical protein
MVSRHGVRGCYAMEDLGEEGLQRNRVARVTHLIPSLMGRSLVSLGNMAHCFIPRLQSISENAPLGWMPCGGLHYSECDPSLLLPVAASASHGNNVCFYTTRPNSQNSETAIVFIGELFASRNAY